MLTLTDITRGANGTVAASCGGGSIYSAIDGELGAAVLLGSLSALNLIGYIYMTYIVKPQEEQHALEVNNSDKNPS